MIRRTFLALLATLPALPAMAAPVPLARLSAYLNSITTAEARFTQFNDDGTRSTGTLYISRPGRMRFEYDPPSDALVLANAGAVAIFDAKSNSDPQQFPLGTTPLSLILGRNIDLGQANMVEKFYEAVDGSTVVVARDPQHPETGKIELFFSPDPIALTEWIVTDQTGAVTAVRLSELKTGMALDNNFFSISREKGLRGR